MLQSQLPVEDPDGLVVFDGACNLCSASVQMVIRMDRQGLIRFSSVQTPYGRALCERHNIDADDPSTFLFFDRGQPRLASDGVLALAARLPAPWSGLQIFRVLPRALRDTAYRLLAKNRYKLFGRRDICLLPTPQLRARFIDAIPSTE